MTIVTLPERKAREAARRAAAARAVINRLRNFVEKTGHRGRFIIFGSVAAGRVRHTSDFDVIVDMPPDLESDAWTAVEEACSAEGIPEDIHSTALSKAEFIELMLLRPVEIIA